MKAVVAVLLMLVLVGCGPATSTAVPSRAPSSATPASPSPVASPSASSAISSPSAVAGMIREVRADAGRSAGGDLAGPDAAAVAAADTAFAMRLYRELAAAKGNLIFSPYSISTALSMTYGGARGTTAAELAGALGVGKDPAAWHTGRNDIDTWLQRPIDPDASGVTPLTIEPTNALFGQDGFPFEDSYLELLARDYGAGLQALDFIADAEASREAINQWVAERTKDRIRQLLGPGTVTDDTRFVLVNAIYFKASWIKPFEAERTTEESFRRLDGTSVTVPMMHGLIESNYKRGSDWQAFDIQYVGATMTVILPDAGQFAKVERRLGTDLLAEAADRPAFDLIHLGLPRWSSAVDLELVENLRRLGVRDLFKAGSADLRGIADADLFVSKVIHQANIDVDEHGTVAAAATAIVGDTTGGGPDDEVTINVDRPFIYVIRDSLSGEILFAGRVLDPIAR